MKPAEGNLERLLKKGIRGQEMAASDLLFHWNGLGRKGDLLVIELLNRHHAWSAMAQHAQENPDIKAKLVTIADLPGITEEAAASLASIGLTLTEGDNPRTRGQWILQAVSENRTVDWPRAALMMANDPDLLAGTLPLIETIESAGTAARFITTILEQKSLPSETRIPNPETRVPAPESRLRKALYHLKQRGATLEAPSGSLLQFDREMFAMGENRVALWQPMLYFRAHSSFTDSGDLYVLRIIEGQDFDPSDQKRDLHLDRDGFAHLASQLSRHLQEDLALSIPVHPIPASAARWFLHKTRHFIQDTPAQARAAEFYTFLGEEGVQDPLSDLRAAERPPLSIASNVLNDSYFYHWTLQTDEVKGYLSALDTLQNGPLILPESQVREKSRRAALESLRSLFTEHTRQLWAFALEKAAFFLRMQDPQKALYALALAHGFEDSHVSVDDLYVANWLFEKTVQRELELKKKSEQEEKRGSLIMTPQEFSDRNKPQGH